MDDAWMERRLVETLQSLIRAAGESPAVALGVCRARLESVGARVASPAEGTLYATRVDDDRPPLVLAGHVDVVPPGDGWSVPPSEGRLADGAVWGRGASDMLGAVACFVTLFESRPDLPLALALTTDEETGMLGALALHEAGVMRGAAGVVVGEPTAFEVGVAEKGVLWVRLVARGRSAHGSMPHLGDNAATKLLRALARVDSIPLAGEDPLLGRPTRSVNLVRAGEAVNVVPERAVAEIDHRFLPGTTPAALVAALEEAAAPDAHVEVLSEHPPFAARDKSPLADAAAAAVAATRGEARRVGFPYGTEACRYGESLDCVILGPGDTRVMHTNEERITVADLVDGYRVYERAADALFATRGR